MIHNIISTIESFDVCILFHGKTCSYFIKIYSDLRTWIVSIDIQFVSKADTLQPLNWLILIWQSLIISMGIKKYWSQMTCHRRFYKSLVRKKWKVWQLVILFKLKVYSKPACTCQKQSHVGALQKRCPEKFCKIHRKTPVPESLAVKWGHVWRNEGTLSIFA